MLILIAFKDRHGDTDIILIGLKIVLINVIMVFHKTVSVRCGNGVG